MPILMLTAADRLDDKVSGFELGADDYLTKPFELRELVLRLRALDRRRACSRPPVRDRRLRLDPFRREVYRDGRYVALTRKQFAVLDVLVAADGGVVSAEELLERAWDEHATRSPTPWSYAGFLMVAGAVLLAAVWVFLLRGTPGTMFVPDVSDLLRAFDPSNFGPRVFGSAAAAVLAFLLVFGLVGGWILAGRMLAPLTRITDAARMATNGSASPSRPPAT